jgi:hypothetical protein
MANRHRAVLKHRDGSYEQFNSSTRSPLHVQWFLGENGTYAKTFVLQEEVNGVLYYLERYD